LASSGPWDFIAGLGDQGHLSPRTNLLDCRNGRVLLTLPTKLIQHEHQATEEDVEHRVPLDAKREAGSPGSG
jgi:hypothetical protein